MSSSETHITAADGVKLRVRTWRPGTAMRGVLVVTHGHGEHLGRYHHIAEVLCAAGYAVYVWDLRGHGRSGGKPGHSPTFLHYIDDLGLVHALARRENPDARLWLMAHSMGGLITLTYVVRKQPDVAGVIASAPLLRAKYAAPGWKVFLARVLSNVAPSLTLSTGLDVSVPMSHDTALLKSFPDPELPHAMMSTRVGNDLLNLMPDTLSRARDCTLPLLLLQGTADGAVDPEATTEFYKNAGSADKTLKIYPGFYHEIMNELERATVMGDITAWLEKRSG